MPQQGQGTEKPTPRRLEKARREGQFAVSRDFVAGLQFATFVALLGAFGKDWLAGMQDLVRFLIERSFRTEITPLECRRLLLTACWRAGFPLATAGAALLAVTVALHFGVTGLGFAGKKLTPDFSRLSPLRRIRELPRQNLPQLIQALVLLPLFAWALYAVVLDRAPTFIELPLRALPASFHVVASSIQDLLWKTALVLVAWGAVDLFRQKRRYMADLRMSKQEIREELKETEGNPQIKSRIRRLQRDLLRRRMMSAVPTATAVVVNPTHYAVALKYHVEGMSAPLVVAKGKNFLALRIRQRAVENQVPVIENAPLAQALYQSVEVGQEIPPALYRAVAEILAYILKLQNRRR